MKIVFMGTPMFAVPVLEALIKNHEVIAVITQPDKPKGRGNKITFSEIKQCALNHGIEILQPNKIKDKDFIEILKQFQADVFIVVAYGQILSKEILNIPKYGSINVHGSLLPKYRGAAPIHWAIINGETQTGVTIMQMDQGVDTGDIILQKSFPIEPEDNFETIHDKMALMGADALIEALDLFESGEVVPIKQDDAKATFAPLITKEIGKIKWDNNSKDIIQLIRALNPWPSAYTFYKGKMLKIWLAEKHPKEYNMEPGTVSEIIKNLGITVATNDGSVLIKEIQMVGGKRMGICDYMRGNKIEVGEQFGNN